MSIYWRNGWAYGRKTIAGVEHRKSFETRIKREAESAHVAWLAELYKEQKAEKQTDASFRVAVDTFTEHHLGTLKKSSQVRYLQSLLNLAGHFDGKNLRAISRADLMSFVTARRKEGVTDGTIIRDLACLSSVFTIAADWEIADANPVLPFLRSQKRRKVLVNGASRTRYLSHAEELSVLNYAAEIARTAAKRRLEKWMICACLVGYIDTGMRAQELLVMNWSWVNLSANEITVPAAVTKSDEPRTIPILPRFKRILEAVPRNKHANLVFWRTTAGRGFDDLNHTFQRYAAACNVANVRIHDLRRTCGCRLLQDHKATLQEVSTWLGHASVVITEAAYAFLETSDLHDAVGTRQVTEDLRPQLSAALMDAAPKIHIKIGTARRHNETNILMENGNQAQCKQS